ncbi:MAG: hypothetical protein U0575_09545 [Phycisphaerales bacterium]
MQRSSSEGFGRQPLEWSVQDVADEIAGAHSDVTIDAGTPMAWADIDCEVYRPHGVIDVEDVRTIVGAMGRFPIFRETGWEVLRSARVAGDSQGAVQ